MATFSVLGSIAASPDTCVSPVLKSSPGLLRSPVSVSAMSSRISSSTVDVRSCRREGDDGFSNGSRSHSDDPYTKILSTVTAFGASALLASTLFNGRGLQLEYQDLKLRAVEAAGALDRVEAGVLFQRTCSGCHSGGSNILQPSATLYKKDLDRNGLTSVDEIYKITYYGKGRMPGYGEKCTPRGQCTFGPRLGDDDIRALAEFVKSQAEEGWRN